MDRGMESEMNITITFVATILIYINLWKRLKRKGMTDITALAYLGVVQVRWPQIPQCCCQRLHRFTTDAEDDSPSAAIQGQEVQDETADVEEESSLPDLEDVGPPGDGSGTTTRPTTADSVSTTAKLSTFLGRLIGRCLLAT
jgi:hypothetical protein